MKIKSIYVGSEERDAGVLLVSLGLIEMLKRKFERVAIFKPIIQDKNIIDKDIELLIKFFNLDIDYNDCFVYDTAQVEDLLSKNQENKIIETLIDKFNSLQKNYDFILCQGIKRRYIGDIINIDLNYKIAQNLNSAYINIINGKNKESKEIYEDTIIEINKLKNFKLPYFATFINRVKENQIESLKNYFKQENSIYFIKESQQLNAITIQDIISTLNAKNLLSNYYNPSKEINSIKIATSNLDRLLSDLNDGDLIISSADRTDIILTLFAMQYSFKSIDISTIILPKNQNIEPKIEKILKGFKDINIPILSTNQDITSIIKNLDNIKPQIYLNTKKKISLALKLFNESIKNSNIEDKLHIQYPNIITPQMFKFKLFEMAKRDKKRIVLPESNDKRILKAAENILCNNVADIILLGDKDRVLKDAKQLGYDISKATIINHKTSKLIEEFADKFYQLRKNKGITKEMAYDAINHPNYFGVMMVELGYADGMVSGARHTTAETIRPAFQIIKTKPNISLASSLFFMCFKTNVLVYADCAINIDPTAQELATIAITTADSAKQFGIEPKIAMLSYSTGNSGKGKDVDKVKEATQIVKRLRKDLIIDGPMQYDAAVSKEVAKIKMPNSKVAGNATVLIFPDLNTGNNTYKAVQRSSGAIAIGPIIQGLKKPVNDLSRGCLVEDVINTIAITAIQAQED